MIFMCDLLETISIFSKVSQRRQIVISEMQYALQLVLANLDRFIDDPDCGKVC